MEEWAAFIKKRVSEMNRFEAGDYIKLLAEQYPKTFFITPQRRRPLKHGIEDDLVKRGPITNPAIVGDILYFYIGHIGYAHACRQAGTSRVDLDGNLAGKVTLAEANEADQRIKNFYALKNQRNGFGPERQAGDIVTEIVKPRRVAPAIPEVVLASDEQGHYRRIEALTAKARSLRMGDKSIGQELAIKALELARSEIDKLIARYSSPTINEGKAA